MQLATTQRLAVGRHQRQLSTRSLRPAAAQARDAHHACEHIIAVLAVRLHPALPVLLSLMPGHSKSTSSGPSMPSSIAAATHCVSSPAAAGACPSVDLPHWRCKIRLLLFAKALGNTLAHSRPKACDPSNEWSWAEGLAHQHAMPAISMSPFACTGVALRLVGQGVEMCPVCWYRVELPLNCSLQGQSGLPVKGLSPTLHTSMAAISCQTAVMCISDLKGLRCSEQSGKSGWIAQPSN